MFKQISMKNIVVQVTDASFENDVLRSQTPVLVFFWAVWAGPLEIIHPIVELIGIEYAGRLKVAKFYIDQNTKMPTNYNVKDVPTLIIFKKGILTATKVGALPLKQLREFIDSNL